MMDKIFERPHLSLSILVAISLYIFFFQLGGLALTDPDETFYAQTAKEMVDRGEWLTPYLYGKPQFEKPIFFYWLVELSFKAFGINEFAARFPSALFGLIGVIAAYLLGTLLYNRRTALFAALILATNVEYIMLSRGCVTDMVLGTLVILGFLFFFYAHIKGKAVFYILSAAVFGVATLTKGPIGIMIPGLILLLYLIMTKDPGIFKKGMVILASTVVFFLVAAPWYLYIYKLHGKEFMDVFFGFHNVVRFLEPEHKIGSQSYYYIPVVLGGFFPWSAFLPFGLWYMFKTSRSGDPAEKRNSIFLLVWFFAIFIFFSASSTKLPTYIFPSFTALALIVGRLWDDFLSDKAASGVVKGVRLSYYLLLAVVVIGAIGLYIFLRFDYPTLSGSALLSGLFFLSGFILSYLAFSRRRFLATFFFMICAVMLLLYPLNKLVIPEIERYETSKEISEKLLALIKGDEKVGAEKDYVAGVSFYTSRPVINTDKHHILLGFVNSKERIWCVLKEKNHRQLYDININSTYVKPSYMVYKLGKKCLLTNEVPEDGRYLVRREWKR